MGKNLLQKASLVLAPKTIPVAGEGPKKPKTAIGAMAQFTDRQSQAIKDAEILKDRLREFEGCLPAKKIDPTHISPSVWMNRHAQSFQDDAFRALKEDIALQGGNVQPIKVRPLKGQAQHYEIVFGHRRHRACLELGIDVLAVIEDMDEKHLFMEMDRENRQRKDLRPLEIGQMYAKALDKGLFTSARKLAEEVCFDQSQLAKALILARMPEEILNAFISPLDLQYRWASDLLAALQRDPGHVLALAKAIQSENPRPSSAKVFQRLVEIPGEISHSGSKTLFLEGQSGQKCQIVFNEKKRQVAVQLSNIDPARSEELQAILQGFLN